MSGAFNRCPICSTSLSAADDESHGDMACPRCAAEIWFVWRNGGHQFWVRPHRQSFEAALADHRERLRARIATLDADSLDMVEIEMETEEFDDRAVPEVKQRNLTPEQVVQILRSRIDAFLSQFD